jgi:hypothetical protein
MRIRVRVVAAAVASLLVGSGLVAVRLRGEQTQAAGSGFKTNAVVLIVMD